MELKDDSALGGFHRIIEIDTVNDADEPGAERNASRERTENVAEVPDALGRVQLGRTYFFSPAAYGDGGATGGAKITHPLDLAPGSPDPPPASYRNDGHSCGALQAALPTANGDKPIGAEWNTSDEQELQDWAEESNLPWNMCAWRHCDLLNSITHLCRSFLASIRSRRRTGDDQEGAGVTARSVSSPARQTRGS
jgi:hypothetical protein